jgi:hypothetical protein
MPVHQCHFLLIVSGFGEPPLKTCLFIKPAQLSAVEISVEPRCKQRVVHKRTPKIEIGLVLKDPHVALHGVCRTPPLTSALAVLSYLLPLALGDVSESGTMTTVFRVNHFRDFSGQTPSIY